MTLLRTQLGNTLRGHRLRQRRTLRDVSGAARVSLGYLSEVERGQKEASSELLASICDALDARARRPARRGQPRAARSPAAAPAGAVRPLAPSAEARRETGRRAARRRRRRSRSPSPPWPSSGPASRPAPALRRGEAVSLAA